MIDLGIGQTENCLFSSEEVKCSALKVINHSNNEAFQYAPEEGLYLLRVEIAKWLTIKAKMEVLYKDILITNGASHALELILKMMVPKGGTIIIEDPTYFFALEIFKDWDLNIITVGLNNGGIDVDEIEEICKKRKVDLVYTIPFNHNPTGITANKKTINKLKMLADKFDFYVASDEVYRFVGDPQPQSMYTGHEQRIFSIGSFSKILGPGFRLGWINTSVQNISDLVKCGVLISGGGVSPLMSLILSNMLETGKVDSICKKT
ncbi:aminotransferase class I/II-fold pyridoxal phosphate-dependent enzyme [Halomonas sp. KO116]|uniref:aminotransferase class I/II-fold pyridoxal phosphate-dependent enzyme n=1 Tax=Halomonas sp. KO116 TaxID=1504981 RepID=UPI0004E39FD0|nr:PLP-dependent aminotransferase family protein [Halomonas sp. KO116]AJY50070.1 putative transcriptional regulator, GntR family [Halomonas sp. KO116]